MNKPLENRPLLPDTWAYTPLPNIVSVHYGAGLTKANRDETGQIPVYGSNGIVGYHSEAVVQSPCIVIGRKGAAGEVRYSNQPCWPIDTAYYALPVVEVHLEYVYHCLRSLNLSSLDRSTAIPSLSRDDLRSVQIPLPPLPEQHRIVDAIETQFTRLDAAVAALQRVKANLARYKASVLAAACEGRLVPTEAELARAERRDYEPAGALLQRILRERHKKWETDQWQKEIARAQKRAAQATRKASGQPSNLRAIPAEEWEAIAEEAYARYLPKNDKWKQKYKEPAAPNAAGLPELPEGWVRAKIGQTFSVYVGSTPRRAREEYWNGDIPWVSSSEVAFCRISSTRECISQLGLDNAATVLHPPGTILLGMIGEGKTRGQAAILDIAACHNQNSAAIRVSEIGLSPEYVYYFFEKNYSHIRGIGSGNNQPALNKARVQSILYPLPPVLEQLRIVAEVERRLSVIADIERAVETSLKRAARLRQSILKRAFEGKLVPQDPSDEPASVLLERIRAGRG